MHMNLEQILRTAQVRRFHIVRLGCEQTVGEHVYCVTHIAIALWQELRPPVSVADLVLWCMSHDIEEGLCGDIPSPTKRAALSLGFDWNDAIRSLVPDAKQPPDMIEDLIKMADLLDAWRFAQTYAISPHGYLVRDRLYKLVFDKADELQTLPRWKASDWREAVRSVTIALTAPVQELTDADLP